MCCGALAVSESVRPKGREACSLEIVLWKCPWLILRARRLPRTSMLHLYTAMQVQTHLAWTLLLQRKDSQNLLCNRHASALTLSISDMNCMHSSLPRYPVRAAENLICLKPGSRAVYWVLRPGTTRNQHPAAFLHCAKQFIGHCTIALERHPLENPIQSIHLGDPHVRGRTPWSGIVQVCKSTQVALPEDHNQGGADRLCSPTLLNVLQHTCLARIL